MFAQFDMAFLLLLILAGISYFSGNMSVTFAVLILMLFKLTPLSEYFSLLQKKGMTLGIVILTASVMVPLATGTIGIREILQTAKSWQGVLAVLVGICVAWLGYRGVNLMEANPRVITGLIVGTLIGVAFFKGVPVGPLIAGGILSLMIGASK